MVNKIKTAKTEDYIKNKLVSEILKVIDRKAEQINPTQQKREPEPIRLEPKMLSRRQRLNRGGIHR